LSWLPTKVAPAANWATDRGNKRTRALLHSQAGLDADAALPNFRRRRFWRGRGGRRRQ